MSDIWPEIRYDIETERYTDEGPGGLRDALKKVEKHIQKHLMQIQAPMGEKPKLVTWMEIC